MHIKWPQDIYLLFALDQLPTQRRFTRGGIKLHNHWTQGDSVGVKASKPLLPPPAGQVTEIRIKISAMTARCNIK